MYEGRVKPFDTLARSSLLVISNKSSFKDAEGETQPARRWLLDLITNPDAADDHRVFRVENHELQTTLGLKERKGLRYAFSEFKDKLPEFRKQLGLASQVRRKNQDDLTPYQRRVLKFNEKLVTYELLQQGFVDTPLRPIPTRDELGPETARADMVKRLEGLRNSLDYAAANDLSLLDSAVPRSVPQLEPDEDPWIPYSVAWPRAFLQQEFDKMRHGDDRLPFEAFMMFFRDDVTLDFLRREYQTPRETGPALALHAIFDAYRQGDAWLFNREVGQYQTMLQERPPKDFSASMLSLESRFNHFQPFLWTAFIYVFVLVLVCVGWLVWERETANRILHRSAMWLLIFALLVHTVALIVRMVISGRPPVTNLYSSAVFIGFGAVILGLCFEWFYRRGIGMAIAAVTGFLTLMVAYYLSMRGDTIEPMRAVLDTQFWLATHVVIITLGYSATFVAGILGAFYVIRGVATPTLTPAAGKDLHRMIYGTLCFAIIFSFVGTVLGGLWGDDSWGRFWGWDPKENGALIIVLWNVLVLHARFGGLVRDRGLAVLAVGGNIVTAWSWFGTNELRVGLHSYGFTEGVLMTLVIFVLIQLLIIVAGCLPKGLWWSFREHDQKKAVPAKVVS
jgi:ABC-type transport system involved in cytochrome c biogenesis permease subunit